MDGAYKGRLHIAMPFISRTNLTNQQTEYNDVHGFYRVCIEHHKEHWVWCPNNGA